VEVCFVSRIELRVFRQLLESRYFPSLLVGVVVSKGGKD
jgi:hypothetical protein